MGKARRFVQIDIRHHQQLEFLQRFPQPFTVRHGHERIAAGHKQRLDLVRPGRKNFIREYPAGKATIQLTKTTDAGPALTIEQLVFLGKAREVKNAAANQRSPFAIQIAGDRVDDLSQPVRQCSVAPHPQTGACHDGRAIGVQILAHQFAQPIRCNISQRCGFFCGPVFRQRPNILDTRHVRVHAIPGNRITGKNLVQKRQEKKHICIGLDEAVLIGNLRCFIEAGINHNDSAAALANLLQPFDRVGHLQKRPLGHHGIGTDNEQAVDVIQIGKRLKKRKAIHGRGGRKAIRTILGCR